MFAKSPGEQDPQWKTGHAVEKLPWRLFLAQQFGETVKLTVSKQAREYRTAQIALQQKNLLLRAACQADRKIRRYQAFALTFSATRSEERRVGKACSTCRWV